MTPELASRQISGLLSWRRVLPSKRQASWIGRLHQMPPVQEQIVLHGTRGERAIYVRNNDQVFVPIETMPGAAA